MANSERTDVVSASTRAMSRAEDVRAHSQSGDRLGFQTSAPGFSTPSTQESPLPEPKMTSRSAENTFARTKSSEQVGRASNAGRQQTRASQPNVRAHERAQYATPPTVPTHRTHQINPTDSPSACLAGSADAREKPPNPPDETFDPTDPGRRLVAIAHERINGTVEIRSAAREITDVFRTRTWATLDRREGTWTIPARYLEHVEKLLDAAGVDLFDVDGIPTPKRRRELADTEHGDSATVLAEIRAKRAWCENHTAEIEHARREARAAFAEAAASIEQTHPEGATP